jgi:hypothetical protein
VHPQALRVEEAQKQQRERKETTVKRTTRIKQLKEASRSLAHNQKEVFYSNM